MREVSHNIGQVEELIKYLQWLYAEEKRIKTLIRKIHEADQSSSPKIRKA